MKLLRAKKLLAAIIKKLNLKKTFLQTLGPGLLFAGAAIGVSHLVQSTKAGAEFGFGLFGLYYLFIFLNILFFNLVPVMLQLQEKPY